MKNRNSTIGIVSCSTSRYSIAPGIAKIRYKSPHLPYLKQITDAFSLRFIDIPLACSGTLTCLPILRRTKHISNRLTIKDIARLSGVGKSTVSRVLNNESGVSQATREKVLAIVNQKGFSPSRSARAMRSQSDKVVGVIVTRLDSLSENLAVQTMLPAFYAAGYDPIMMESQFSLALVEEHLRMLRQRNVDGVILFGCSDIPETLLRPWQ